MQFTRRQMLIMIPAFAAVPALANHDWSWTRKGQFALEGTIRQAQLGTPNGVLVIDTGAETWMADIGTPESDDEAGLTETVLAPGTRVTVTGQRAADTAERQMKAETLTIAGRTYRIAPSRT